MSQSKFLIVLLALLTLMFACTNRASLEQDIASPFSPAQTVRNYWKAQETGDFELLWKCLAKSETLTKESSFELIGPIFRQTGEAIRAKGGIKSIDIERQEITGETATVIRTLRFGNGESSRKSTDNLIKEQGEWKWVGQ
jgi:hypothetical protein